VAEVDYLRLIADDDSEQDEEEELSGDDDLCGVTDDLRDCYVSGSPSKTTRTKDLRVFERYRHRRRRHQRLCGFWSSPPTHDFVQRSAGQSATADHLGNLLLDGWLHQQQQLMEDEVIRRVTAADRLQTDTRRTASATAGRRHRRRSNSIGCSQHPPTYTTMKAGAGCGAGVAVGSRLVEKLCPTDATATRTHFTFRHSQRHTHRHSPNAFPDLSPSSIFQRRDNFRSAGIVAASSPPAAATAADDDSVYVEYSPHSGGNDEVGGADCCQRPRQDASDDSGCYFDGELLDHNAAPDRCSSSAPVDANCSSRLSVPSTAAAEVTEAADCAAVVSGRRGLDDVDLELLCRRRRVDSAAAAASLSFEDRRQKSLQRLPRPEVARRADASHYYENAMAMREEPERSWKSDAASARMFGGSISGQEHTTGEGEDLYLSMAAGGGKDLLVGKTVGSMDQHRVSGGRRSGGGHDSRRRVHRAVTSTPSRQHPAAGYWSKAAAAATAAYCYEQRQIFL
jgi:hypothetical protein